MIPLDKVVTQIAEQTKAVCTAEETARKPQIVEALNEPTRKAVYQGGELKMIEVAKPTRGHTILTLDDFADAVKRWGTDQESTVFVNASGLTLVCDDEYRMNRVKMPIAESEGFALAAGLVGGKTFNHASVIQLLRTDLRQYLLSTGSDFLTYIKSIKFGTKTSGNSAISQAGASMGQSVEMELLGVDGREVPEEFQIKVPVFAAPAPSIEETIRVDVTIDFASANFKLIANADLIQQSRTDSLRVLRQSLLDLLGEGFDPKRVLLGTL